MTMIRLNRSVNSLMNNYDGLNKNAALESNNTLACVLNVKKESTSS